eukprot:TRINITY_DN14211_c0_g1_i1.p1 TRINITY_DN14211_c0_g1~~TRINITY_DN14211_c0_g1_i1.p1  ORF type:complete len:523 (+),score=124.57 TRINITY_DN14211_c0_g1_i1:102-1670(+)
MLPFIATRKRGIFADAVESPFTKRQAMENPEYLAAFQTFVDDKNGCIGVHELKSALLAVKHGIEDGTPRALSGGFRFQDDTVFWLAARFGKGAPLRFPEFVELLVYVQNAKSIFQQVDADHSGSISLAQLGRALQLSGWNVPSAEAVSRIGRSYDPQGTGELEFDAFVQLRLEWEVYIEVWEKSVPPGASTISPDQLLMVLEDVKHACEPIAQFRPGTPVGRPGYGLLHSSMWGSGRPFHRKTCETLIIKFGGGNYFITFEQFCLLMEFLKDLKKAFRSCDDYQDGALHVSGLGRALALNGLPLPEATVQEIGRRFDSDASGKLEFDEFVQMMTEFHDLQQFNAMNYDQNMASATDLQLFFGSVRVVFRTVRGAIPGLRPFHLSTCRSLVARFGVARAGELFATRVTYAQFLELMTFVKLVAWRFQAADIDSDGELSFDALGPLLLALGLPLPAATVDVIRRSYDSEGGASFELDEFLRMVLECDMLCRMYRQHRDPVTGNITLSEVGFLSLLYSMPRDAGV